MGRLCAPMNALVQQKTLTALYINSTDQNFARFIGSSKVIEHLQNEKNPLHSKSTSSNSEYRIIIDHKINISITTGFRPIATSS